MSLQNNNAERIVVVREQILRESMAGIGDIMDTDGDGKISK